MRVTTEDLNIDAKTHRGIRPLLLWQVQRHEGAAEVVAGLRRNQTSGSWSRVLGSRAHSIDRLGLLGPVGAFNGQRTVGIRLLPHANSKGFAQLLYTLIMHESYLMRDFL